MKRNILEVIFKETLWKCRLIAILAVIFGMVGSIALFLIASYDIVIISKKVYMFFFGGYRPLNFHEILIEKIIGAVHLYLVAVVMLIFSFGIYELFISEIDDKEGNKILTIHSLDELKDKLGKVVVMVLIIGFFKRVMNIDYSNPMEMMFLAGSILMLSLALHFMHKPFSKGGQ
ncbi:MAG TPA: YqhA family protein [Methanothermococcus okinawensis]|uniref:YqhA family protein n=1 Tax=Methanothermococcus okinawensis TaxID=155863 RepID=A0A833E122_9EURY|nr:YqhA family protein [Methanothermococcus okinawensis]